MGVGSDTPTLTLPLRGREFFVVGRRPDGGYSPAVWQSA